jgi:hypothetical protein
MKWKAAIIVMGAVLVSGTACANSVPNSVPNSVQSPPTGTSSSASSSAPVTVTEPAGTPLPASQLDATALSEAYPKKVVLSSDAKKLTITAVESGCGKASAELGEQNPQRVKVVLVETTPATSQLCPMNIRYPQVSVDLDAALGQRIVELRSEQRKS